MSENTRIPHPSESYKCPTCAAEPNQRCRTRNNREAAWPHVQRMRSGETREQTPTATAANVSAMAATRQEVDHLLPLVRDAAWDEVTYLMEALGGKRALTTCEIVALLAVLRPAWERVYAQQREPAPVLKLMRRVHD
ncbi:hypothetical protein Mycsm_05350 [Mycobacterium sp. JS623]|uniref:zinc finger domain-containing protein n=1 Tax=Mycobacterium sp. JS623 TaxID=212767 RepID=UPI0002A5A70F|nr:hypothetical protein Mycsm_05350 [Mycobacterium sp. JS623]